MCLTISSVAAAKATTIAFGPTTGPSAFGDADGGGTRANFDHLHPVTLGTGSWSLTNFEFQASQAGDALPVLATICGGLAGSGHETYTIIAFGADTSVAGSGLYSEPQSGGSTSFTLPTTETVYAGFINLAAQPVDWQ